MRDQGRMALRARVPWEKDIGRQGESIPRPSCLMPNPFSSQNGSSALNEKTSSSSPGSVLIGKPKSSAMGTGPN